LVPGGVTRPYKKAPVAAREGMGNDLLKEKTIRRERGGGVG